MKVDRAVVFICVPLFCAPFLPAITTTPTYQIARPAFPSNNHNATHQIARLAISRNNSPHKNLQSPKP